jgi:hypothetical protein
LKAAAMARMRLASGDCPPEEGGEQAVGCLTTGPTSKSGPPRIATPETTPRHYPAHQRKRGIALSTNPTEFPLFPDRTIPVPLPPPVVGELLVDRDGETWRVTDQRDASGNRVLACDAPSDPEDQGDGPSFPWTLRSVEMWFGPLVRPLGGAL